MLKRNTLLSIGLLALVLSLQSQEWTQIGDDIDGEAPWDHSGESIDISDDGTVVAIGADGNDGNGHHAGHVRVFQ